jgi:hypothetical protein
MIGRERKSIVDQFLWLHGFILVGLAVLGRGFAYMGIGEVALMLGLAVMALCPAGVGRVFSLLPSLLLLPLMGWGMYRTIPFIHEYGFLALRDAALWGFSLWAVVIATVLVSRPRRLVVTIARYRWFSAVAIVALPVAYFTQYLAADKLPLLWGGIPIVQLKMGDTLVHLGAIGAFMLMAPVSPMQFTSRYFIPIWALFFLVGNRAGQLSSTLMFMAAVGVRGMPGRVMAMIALMCIPLALFIASGFSFELAGKEVSVQRLTNALGSIVGQTSADRYENTKEWRLNWWKDIIGYTIDGPYYWTGKGFGVNLADDDGYALSADSALRSPHNSHMTFLARMGVPGLALWGILNLSWAYGILTSTISAWHTGRRKWFRLFIFVGIFWAGIMVDATFDVVLEGPMMALWFWSIFGVGLASMWIYRNAPETLSDIE